MSVSNPSTDTKGNPAGTTTQVSARKPVSLALQGGGSWGAYTWGVLDALLSGRSVDIAQLSGTSAGALNAAVVASALASGSRESARKALASFWSSIASPPDPTRDLLGPMERPWREAMGAWLLSNFALSPYSANPLGYNPLRKAVEAHVDIEAVRSKWAPALYVTITNVKTGLPRVVANDAMSIDVLLASACIPQVFHAVEIDGESYWDGGYGGNPTLWPMIHGGGSRDVIVVQLAPETSPEVPRDAASIRRRVNEIVFNSSLVAEMQAIAAMRSLARGKSKSGLQDLRLHRIGPPEQTLSDPGSAFERSRQWLEALRDQGRSAARRFIARHAAELGVRETLDIGRVFTDARKPKMRVPAAGAPAQADPDPGRHGGSSGASLSSGPRVLRSEPAGFSSPA